MLSLCRWGMLSARSIKVIRNFSPLKSVTLRNFICIHICRYLYEALTTRSDIYLLLKITYID